MDLDSLIKKPLTELSPDEAIELIRQLRLSRRTKASKPKTTVTRKAAASAVVNKMTAAQAAELLTMLKGN